MPYLDNFNYQILGQPSAPKLVFLHGLMGSGANWRGITPAFSDDFEILLLDQRGHGRSFQPDEGYRPEDYAEDLKHILDELGWQKIDLVGHSMGGRNALVFASLYPEMVGKLVIEDIGPDINHKASDRIKYLVNLVPTPFANRNEARQFFNGEFMEKIKLTPNARVLSQYFYSNIAENAAKQADWRFSKKGVFASLDEARQQERWKELKALKVKTYLIRGEKSAEISNEVFEEMLKCNSHITGQVVKGSGHWVHSEKPMEFTKLLRNFLTS